MWKITWYDVTDYNYKEECYETFEEARKRFRLAIKEDMSLQIPNINACVDDFCKKVYKRNIPQTFNQLKFFLEKFITTPDYPQYREDVEEIWTFEDYEDEKVDIWLSDHLELNIDFVDDDLINNGDFFDGQINFDIGLVKIEPLYCFIIRDNKEQFADNRLFCHIELKDLERQDEIDAAAKEWANQFIEAMEKANEQEQ